MLVGPCNASDDARERKREPAEQQPAISDQSDPNVDATSNRESTPCARCGFCQHAWLRSKPFQIAVKGMSS